jgi:hypothetical protein
MVLSGLSSATQLLQPGVFLLQLFQLPNQVDFQTDVLLLPAIEGLLSDSHLPAQFHHRHPHLGLLQLSMCVRKGGADQGWLEFCHGFFLSSARLVAFHWYF